MSNDGSDHSVPMDTLVEMDKWRNQGRDEQGGQHSLSPLETHAHTRKTQTLAICAAHCGSQMDCHLSHTATQPAKQDTHLLFSFLGKEIGAEVEQRTPKVTKLKPKSSQFTLSGPFSRNHSVLSLRKPDLSPPRKPETLRSAPRLDPSQ